jgi:ribosomal protein S27AE
MNFDSLGHNHGYNQIPWSTVGDRTARSNAERARLDTAQLQDRVDRLSLICLAMWSLIEEKTGLTQEDLARRVEEIDLQDGLPDGKVTRTVRKCDRCGRTLSPRHNRCMYCGAGGASDSPFDHIIG